MSITDTQFRVIVAGAGCLLVAGIAWLGLFGAVSLPDKPPPPRDPTGTSSQLLTRSVASPTMYDDFLARDAATAGVHAPTRDEMSRKLPYRVDEARYVLAVGQPAREIAGLQLRALHLQEGLGLEITNATGSDVAYNVVTATVPAARCNPSAVLPFNAMTIGKDRHETRVECQWFDGVAVAVLRVETLEVPALSAWYLGHVPPSIVGIEPRIARGHLPPGQSRENCGFALPQTVRNGFERGEIGWRDLVDFYARHRCQTYQFPPSYRAFKTDGERPVPAVSAGM